jgi:thiamine-phosphate pyrophosphorylase
MDKSLRIIDANFNRAREGLRVIEDIMRLYYENRQMVKAIKDFRQDFSEKIISQYGFYRLRKQRNADKDQGKDFDNTGKCDIVTTLQKNLLRVGEALRVIEEFSKIKKPKTAGIVHSFRFRFYTIEKKITESVDIKKIPLPCVYVIINLQDRQDISGIIKKTVAGNPDIIQLRYKGNNSGFFLSSAIKTRKLIPKNIIYIVNDRADICILSEADGIHVGQEDLPPAAAKTLLEDKIIGLSTHNLTEIKKAVKQNIDYIAVGSIFHSPTKPQKKPQGTEILTQAKKEITIPLIAIGGINIKNCGEIINNGADGVAVSSLVEKSAEPGKTIQKLKRMVDKHWQTKIKIKKAKAKKPATIS